MRAREWASFLDPRIIASQNNQTDHKARLNLLLVCPFFGSFYTKSGNSVNFDDLCASTFERLEAEWNGDCLNDVQVGTLRRLHLSVIGIGVWLYPLILHEGA